MWWDQLMQVKQNDKNNINLEVVHKVFQNKYLSQCYYDRMMKEFFELKLGSMTMDEYERIFLEF
jgi:hypothetical protein